MTDAICRQVLEAHPETLTAVCDAGRAIANSWGGPSVADPARITGPLQRLLADSPLAHALLEALATAVEAAGERLRGAPVPAPPYLVATSRGPVCRATLDTGRLLLRFELFAVERQPRAYRFLDPDPERCLAIERR